MKAHLESLITACAATGAQGKRLDFVCQELGREINTIGSKSMTLEIDRSVIAVKDSLEKIREQIRNVEIESRSPICERSARRHSRQEWLRKFHRFASRRHRNGAAGCQLHLQGSCP